MIFALFLEYSSELKLSNLNKNRNRNTSYLCVFWTKHEYYTEFWIKHWIIFSELLTQYKLRHHSTVEIWERIFNAFPGKGIQHRLFSSNKYIAAICPKTCKSSLHFSGIKDQSINFPRPVCKCYLFCPKQDW